MKFFSVQDPQSLLPILEARLPQACYIYNQLIMYPKCKEDLSYYTLGSELTSSSWIVGKNIREDYGFYISISAPPSISSGAEEISAEVRRAFSSEDLIPWLESIRLIALEKVVAGMVYDISVNVKGNVTETRPCYLFYMDKEEALQLEINPSPSPDVEVRRLDPEEDSHFILETWAFAKEGSDVVVRRNIRTAASAGVFVDGKCVSGVITVGNGLVSSLFTLEEYRGRGYGKWTMKYVMKEVAKEGCIPCLTVEFRNEKGVQMYRKLGMKLAAMVDWICLKKEH